MYTSLDTGIYQEYVKNLDTSFNTSRSIKFCKSRNLRSVFWPMMTWITWVSFTKPLRDIKALF